MISGTLTSLNSYVYVYHLGLPSGKLTISGSVSADTYAYLYSDGHAQIGMVDAGIDIYADRVRHDVQHRRSVDGRQLSSTSSRRWRRRS